MSTGTSIHAHSREFSPIIASPVQSESENHQVHSAPLSNAKGWRQLQDMYQKDKARKNRLNKAKNDYVDHVADEVEDHMDRMSRKRQKRFDWRKKPAARNRARSAPVNSAERFELILEDVETDQNPPCGMDMRSSNKLPKRFAHLYVNPTKVPELLGKLAHNKLVREFEAMFRQNTEQRHSCLENGRNIVAVARQSFRDNKDLQILVESKVDETKRLQEHVDVCNTQLSNIMDARDEGDRETAELRSEYANLEMKFDDAYKDQPTVENLDTEVRNNRLTLAGHSASIYEKGGLLTNAEELATRMTTLELATGNSPRRVHWQDGINVALALISILCFYLSAM